MSDFNNFDYGDFFDSYDPNKQSGSQSRKNGSRKPKHKKRRLKKRVKLVISCVAIVLSITVVAVLLSNINKTEKPPEDATASYQASETMGSVNVVSSSVPDTTTEQPKIKIPSACNYTVTLGNEIESPYAVLIDVTNNTILARRNANEIIYPASMTKVMTLLVAAENIKNTEDTFEMSYAIIDPLYKEGLTLAGFGHGEKVKLIDMFYGMTLESGADAAVGLACYVSGSEEEFVKLMNKKCAELGLKNTHFTNASGMHNKSNYTTCTEMAVIMNAAMENDFCRKILSTEWYTVPANEFHKELKYHSGMFEKMYGTEPKVATIKGGKTGFTSQAMFCLASFGVTDDGRSIICVTAKGDRKYAPIYDAIELYKDYTHPN